MPRNKHAFTSLDDTLEKVVRLLKSHREHFISGEDLSRSLGLSRAAVWKNVKKLNSLDYKITSKQKSGYRLVSKTRRMLPWEVSDGLQTETIGRKIYYFDTIDSTQKFALGLATKPRENGSIVIAERQTHGRGRQNRKWVSPRGGIWLSILLKPNFEVYQASLFPMATSLALCMSIEKTLGIKPKLRWPNDVTLNGKKVAGILVDGSVQSNKIDYLVIGIGINFRVSPREISKNIKGATYGVTTLVGAKSDVEPTVLLQSLLAEIETIYNKMISGNLKGIKEEWEKRSSTLGKRVKILTTGSEVSGKAVGLSEEGALLVLSRGRTHRVLVGDVLIQSGS